MEPLEVVACYQADLISREEARNHLVRHITLNEEPGEQDEMDRDPFPGLCLDVYDGETGDMHEQPLDACLLREGHDGPHVGGQWTW